MNNMDNAVEINPSGLIAAIKGQRNTAMDDAAMFSAAVESMRAEIDALTAENAALKAKLEEADAA